MALDLADRVALVTGSSTGIGAAIALALGGSGARVAVHYRASRSQAEEIVERLRATGTDAEAFGADLAQRGEGD